VANHTAAGNEPKSNTERPNMTDQQKLVEEKWKQIRGAIKAKWTQLGDQDLEMIDGDSRKLVALVHQKTNLPLHEIEEGIDEIASQSEGLLSRLVRTASDFAQSAGSFAQSAGSQVSAPVQRVYSQARRLVEDQPMPSVASVFGAGLLVGLLCYALAASDDR
jgi:ElaB/YqjD/DUF883 family membrane-anchored ribosome-binding protein